MNNTLTHGKKEWEEKYNNKSEELIGLMSRIERDKEIGFNKHDFYKTISTQTDLDLNLIKKYHAAYDIHNNNKSVVIIFFITIYRQVINLTTSSRMLNMAIPRKNHFQRTNCFP